MRKLKKEGQETDQMNRVWKMERAKKKSRQSEKTTMKKRKILRKQQTVSVRRERPWMIRRFNANRKMNGRNMRVRKLVGRRNKPRYCQRNIQWKKEEDVHTRQLGKWWLEGVEVVNAGTEEVYFRLKDGG